MGWRRLNEKAWSENRLFSVLIELTYRCNLDCVFCYNDLTLRGRPLSREQYLHLFRELQGLGVLHLILSGGEPLAHPDFFLLGGRARELGFVIRVKSNGHSLDKARVLRLRDEVEPFIVEISLHGARAESHERQTRVQGSFRRLLDHLEILRTAGLRVQLNSTLTAWNEDEIEDMFALADRLGLPLRFDPEVSPRDDGDRSPLEIRASKQGIRRLFEIEANRALARGKGRPEAAPGPAPKKVDAARPSKHCGAGSAGIAVDPFGNVYPCVQWRRPVGNLHDQGIREIWSGKGGLDQIRSETSRVKERLEAELGSEAQLLAFCPGAAEARAGSPLAVYGAARQRLEIRRQVMAERQTPSLLPIVD